MVKKSLSRQVEDQLYDMIVSGNRFHLGDKLPNENELSQELGVSRSTLREAVCSLTVQGILEARQGSGTYIVGKLSHDGSEGLKSVQRMKVRLREVFEMRLILEPKIAYLATRRASDQEREEALGIGRRLGEYLSKRSMKTMEQCKRWIAEDQAFHRAIVAMAQNSYFNHLMPIIGRSISEGVLLSDDYREAQLANTILDHQRIIDFMEAGDADGAQHAMALHIHHAMTVQNFE